MRVYDLCAVAAMTEPGSSAAHTQLVKECLEELGLMGYPAWQNQTGAGEMHGRFMRFGKTGSGDILSLFPTLVAGRLYGIHGEIECKTGNAVQNKKQKTHMRVVQNNGGVYLVIRDRREIAPKLEALGFQPRNPAYLPSSGPVLFL